MAWLKYTPFLKKSGDFFIADSALTEDFMPILIKHHD